jgi:hypothetical protein
LLAAPYSLAGHGGVGPGLAPAFASHDAYQQLLQQQDYELRLQFRQQEQLMHAAAPANLHGANASLSSSNMDSLMPAQPIGAQPGMLGPGWDIADYSRANTAAVAAAASAAFGTPSVGGGGGVAGSLSAAGSFMASNSIW